MNQSDKKFQQCIHISVPRSKKKQLYFSAMVLDHTKATLFSHERTRCECVHAHKHIHCLGTTGKISKILLLSYYR